MRKIKEDFNQVTIREDVKLPGTNIILEKGDVISVNNSNIRRVRENNNIDVCNDIIRSINGLKNINKVIDYLKRGDYKNALITWKNQIVFNVDCFKELLNGKERLEYFDLYNLPADIINKVSSMIDQFIHQYQSNFLRTFNDVYKEFFTDDAVEYTNEKDVILFILDDFDYDSINQIPSNIVLDMKRYRNSILCKINYFFESVLDIIKYYSNRLDNSSSGSDVYDFHWGN